MAIKLNRLDATSRQSSPVAGSYRTTGRRSLILHLPLYPIPSVFLHSLPGPGHCDKDESAVGQTVFAFLNRR